MPKKPEPLKPLISLDELKRVVAGLIGVPKPENATPESVKSEKTKKVN